jgi:hypothetical protein
MTITHFDTGLSDTLILKCGICGSCARLHIYPDKVAIGFCDNGHPIRAIQKESHRDTANRIKGDRKRITKMRRFTRRSVAAL